MTLKEFMITAISEQLEYMEGQEVYGADLGYEVFREANCNGSYTYNAYEARQWVKEYFDELGDVVEDIKYNLGAECISNVFNEVEKFQVVCMLELSSSLLGQCTTINNNWNNSLELTEDNIKQIISELKKV